MWGWQPGHLSPRSGLCPLPYFPASPSCHLCAGPIAGQAASPGTTSLGSTQREVNDADMSTIMTLCKTQVNKMRDIGGSPCRLHCLDFSESNSGQPFFQCHIFIRGLFWIAGLPGKRAWMGRRQCTWGYCRAPRHLEALEITAGLDSLGLQGNVHQKQIPMAVAALSAVVFWSSMFQFAETETQIRVAMGARSASPTGRGSFHLLMLARWTLSFLRKKDIRVGKKKRVGRK